MPVLQEAIQAQTAGQHWLLEKPNNMKQQPFEDWENLLSHVVPQQIIPVYSVSTNPYHVAFPDSGCFVKISHVKQESATSTNPYHVAFPDSGCFVKISHVKQESATNRNSRSELEIMLVYSAACKHQRLPSRETKGLQSADSIVQAENQRCIPCTLSGRCANSNYKRLDDTSMCS